MNGFAQFADAQRIGLPDGSQFQARAVMCHPDRVVLYGSADGGESADDFMEIVPPAAALKARGGDITKLDIFDVLRLGWEEASVNGDMVESPNYKYLDEIPVSNQKIFDFLPAEFYDERGWTYKDGNVVICSDLLCAMRSGEYDWCGAIWEWDTKKRPAQITNGIRDWERILWFREGEQWLGWKACKDDSVWYKITDIGHYCIAKAPKNQWDLELTEQCPALYQKLNEMIDGLEPIFFKNENLYLHTLGMLNAYISAQAGVVSDSYDRFRLHQEVNKMMSERFCFVNNCKMVTGFFRPGEAEELSLFSGELETVDERFEICSEKLPCLVIGRGPETISVNVYPKESFNLSQSQDFGWEDGYGVHIERYDATTRKYYRESMSGRTCYTLCIPKEGGPVEVL